MSKNKKTKRRKKRKSNIVLPKERKPVIGPFFERNWYRLRNLGIAAIVLAVMLGGVVFFNDYFIYLNINMFILFTLIKTTPY